MKIHESGRGVWWCVTESVIDPGTSFISWAVHVDPPEWALRMGLDSAVARMVMEGHADAIAAVLECSEDDSFQAAVAKAVAAAK